MNEPLYSEVVDITKYFLDPSNSKIYEREPRYNEACQSLGPSLYRGLTVRENVDSPQAPVWNHLQTCVVCFLLPNDQEAQRENLE